MPRGGAIIVRLFCFLVLVTLAAGCAPTSPSRIDDPERPILKAPASTGTDYITVLGDGYSVGEGKTGADPAAWPRLITRLLHDRGFITEISAYADISSGYVEHDKGGKTFLDMVKRTVGTNTKLVVIFGGDRDVSALPHGSSLEARIWYTFDLVRTRSPRARLLVIGPATAGPPTPDIERVRDRVQEQAIKAGADFVDPLDEGWFLQAPQLFGAVRLNADGQKYLAQKIAPLIAGQLSQQRP